MKKVFIVLIVLAILTCGMSSSFAGDHVNNTTDLNKAMNRHMQKTKV